MPSLVKETNIHFLSFFNFRMERVNENTFPAVFNKIEKDTRDAFQRSIFFFNVLVYFAKILLLHPKYFKWVFCFNLYNKRSILLNEIIK